MSHKNTLQNHNHKYKICFIKNRKLLFSNFILDVIISQFSATYFVYQFKVDTPHLTSLTSNMNYLSSVMALSLSHPRSDREKRRSTELLAVMQIEIEANKTGSGSISGFSSLKNIVVSPAWTKLVS